MCFACRCVFGLNVVHMREIGMCSYTGQQHGCLNRGARQTQLTNDRWNVVTLLITSPSTLFQLHLLHINIRRPLTHHWLSILFLFRMDPSTLNTYIKVRKDKVILCIFRSFTVPNGLEFVALPPHRLSCLTINSPCQLLLSSHRTEIHLFTCRYVGFYERPWTTHVWAGGHL